MNFNQDDILEELDDDEKITHFIPQIAKDENFEDLIYDPGELGFKFFLHIANINTTEKQKYYGRYAIITDKKGLYAWSESDMTIATDLDEYKIEDAPPRMRQPLRVKLDFENNEMPYSCFWLNLEEPTIRIKEGHIATTWLILDEFDTVKFHSVFDKDNLYKIFINTILPENNIYKILTMQHYANNDSSVLGSEIIYIPKSKFTTYKEKDEDGNGTYNDSDKIQIEIEIPEDSDNGIIELIKNGEVIYSEETTEYSEDKPEYDNDNIIISRVKSNKESLLEEWTYRVFVNYNYKDRYCDGFEYELPGTFCRNSNDDSNGFEYELPGTFKGE